MLGPGCLLIEMIKALGLNQPISEFFWKESSCWFTGASHVGLVWAVQIPGPFANSLQGLDTWPVLTKVGSQWAWCPVVLVWKKRARDTWSTRAVTWLVIFSVEAFVEGFGWINVLLFYLLLPTWIELWNQKEAPEFPESSLLLTSPVFSLGSAEGVAAERVTLSLSLRKKENSLFLSCFLCFLLLSCYVLSFISMVFPVFLWFPRQTFGEKLVVFGLALRGAALLPRFAGSAQLLRFAGVGPMAVGAAVSLYELGGWRLVLAVPTSVGVAVSASMLTEQKLEEGTKGGPRKRGTGFGDFWNFVGFFEIFLFLLHFSGWLVDSCFFWMSGMVNHVYRFL